MFTGSLKSILAPTFYFLVMSYMDYIDRFHFPAAKYLCMYLLAFFPPRGRAKMEPLSSFGKGAVMPGALGEDKEVWQHAVDTVEVTTKARTGLTHPKVEQASVPILE